MTDIHETLTERGATHGDSTIQFEYAQAIKQLLRWAVNWGSLNNHEREAIETIATKMSRIVSGNPHEPDHWKDIAGYATLVYDKLVKTK